MCWINTNGFGFKLQPLFYKSLKLWIDLHDMNALIESRASTPLRPWCIFLPVSDFPLFSTNFPTLWKISKMLPFFWKKFPIFIRQNFWWPFSHQPQISNVLPIFPVLLHFHPVSPKLLFPPTFSNFPPVFEKFTCFLHTLCLFLLPPTLTMMHLCITQCTYWTPLIESLFEKRDWSKSNRVPFQGAENCMNTGLCCQREYNFKLQIIWKNDNVSL